MSKQAVLVVVVLIIAAGIGGAVWFSKPTTTEITDSSTQTSTDTSEPTPTPPPNSGQPPVNMEPQTPPELTADQNAQLELGSAAHDPTTLTFDVHGGMFYYVPNVIHVKKGDTVKINFIDDSGFHDFTLDEFAVKIGPIKTGETASAEFVADKTGEFQYYCSVGTHRQMGQWGTLIVE
jgi:plastocyanin